MAAWRRTVDVSDVFRDGALPIAAKAGAIWARLRALAPWGADPGLDALLDGLEAGAVAGDFGRDVACFDDVWEGVYDWADRERVWIVTRRPSASR